MMQGYAAMFDSCCYCPGTITSSVRMSIVPNKIYSGFFIPHL
ncbi:hypothetical protein CIP106467_0401 [Citrobacter europaeus]|nr:hypothetical protein CIP106467_0401 [Citrobacter europaeus]